LAAGMAWWYRQYAAGGEPVVSAARCHAVSAFLLPFSAPCGTFPLKCSILWPMMLFSSTFAEGETHPCMKHL
jgi:hypothetical protein